jgi:competence protein ComEA
MIRQTAAMVRQLIGMLALAGSIWAQELPDKPGRAATERLCKQCHELARVTSVHQDREAWNASMQKMVAYGMKSSKDDYATVLNYLASSFPAEEITKINVNTASAIELESGLSLRRSQSKSLIAYREKNGPFKSLDDLKKVPLMDAAQIDEKKDRIAF